MDLVKLHKSFKDVNSPSVEFQLRWLQKQGFSKDHIDKAILLGYTEIAEGKVFKSGAELNLYLKDLARKFQMEELTNYTQKLGDVEEIMRQKWNNDLIQLTKSEHKKQPLWKRILLFRITK